MQTLFEAGMTNADYVEFIKTHERLWDEAAYRESLREFLASGYVMSALKQILDYADSLDKISGIDLSHGLEELKQKQGTIMGLKLAIDILYTLAKGEETNVQTV